MIDVTLLRPCLENEEARRARAAYCLTTANAFVWAGEALNAQVWLFPDDATRGTSMVTRMGGQLARGTCTLLDAGNAYAAGALVRQFVEVEYLLWCFVDDPLDPRRWLNGESANFTPAAMRKRSDGRFRASEYRSHCHKGGHPHPDGWYLVADSPPADPVLSAWLDFGQHLERAWNLLAAACAAVGVSLATECHADAVENARAEWHAHDWLAPRFTDTDKRIEGLVKLIATADSAAS